jgi:hypothetical protein
MATHRRFTDILMPAAAGATSWCKGEVCVSFTAILINGQQPSGY